MSLSCTVRPTFIICFHWSLLLVFSLYFPSSSANVSKPYVLASTAQQSRTFVLSLLEIFLSAITAFTFLHAFAPVCIMRSTAQIHQIIYFLSSLCFPTHNTSVLLRFNCRPYLFHSYSVSCNSSRSAKITRSFAYIIFLIASAVLIFLLIMVSLLR